jgi:hypothetical protein
MIIGVVTGCTMMVEGDSSYLREVVIVGMKNWWIATLL